MFLVSLKPENYSEGKFIKKFIKTNLKKVQQTATRED